MHYIYAPRSYPGLLGWDKFIFCTKLNVLCLSKICHRTSHSGQHICPGLVQYYFIDVPPIVHIVYIFWGHILSYWADLIFFKKRPRSMHYTCACIVSSAVQPVQIYFLYQARSMHYTYVPASCPELFSQLIIIFVTNLGLCIILMCPGRVLSCSAGPNLFSLSTSVYALYLCARVVSWALRRVDYYFRHQHWSMHYTYVPASCPQLFGRSKFIFFTNLGLCIILMCPCHVMSSSAGQLLFSSPTSAYALYLCTRVISWAIQLRQIYFLYKPRCSFS